MYQSMRKLALSDEILLSIDKPARYIGGEVNSVMKDPSQVDIRFAMCFPDVYEISMSHLGIQILYDMFNRREDVWCERVFSPWVDLDRVMREKKIPLFALESQDPVKEFDFLGITLQYEMSYTNILQVLDLSGIPLHTPATGRRRTPSSSAAAPAPTTRSRWQISSTSFISARGRRSTTGFLTCTRKIRRTAAAGESFWRRWRSSPACMCRRSTRSPTARTALSPPSPLSIPTRRR